MEKRIAPAAIVALKEALTDLYWYRNDLQSFLTSTLGDSALLSQVDWSQPKRNTVGYIVDRLQRQGEQGRDHLIQLMLEVASVEDFGHLERLEEGTSKARRAKQSVEVLKKLVAGHAEILRDARIAEERRRIAADRLQRTAAVKDRLAKLSSDYAFLLASAQAQKRGYQLQQLLVELFDLFDMDPKASFKVAGEQIDGAFSFEGTDYLVEARWVAEPQCASDLDALSGKLSRKLDNTLGLFVSINGFSLDAVRLHSSGRAVVLLMDGADLMAVLEGRISLPDLFLRKRRHAAQTGNIYLTAAQILSE